MSAEFPTLPANDVSPLRDALRLQRQICILRAGGKADAATKLEQFDLPAALELLNASGNTTPVAPLLAAEEARVAEAMMLAKVLAPLLAAELAAQPPPALPRLKHASPALSTTGLPVPAPGEPVPSIADFIDGMLAQDRATARHN